MLTNSRYFSPSECKKKFNFLTPVQSVLSYTGNDINLYQVGNGEFKIFAWSQMHGNETTTTRALCKFIDYLTSDIPKVKLLTNKISFFFIPQLNPDGAELYTRTNSNKIDLNRDAYNLTQIESIFLRSCLMSIKPDLCLNLHDQRTVFSAGYKRKSAIISFLAPSYNKERDYNEVRKKATDQIVAIYKYLYKYISGHIGRFDDVFDINCTGDMFASLGFPTILIEAGHNPLDYHRNITVEYVYTSLKKLIENIVTPPKIKPIIGDYLLIPKNEECFFDIIINNYKVKNKLVRVAIQYKEVLKKEEIIFVPKIKKIGQLTQYYGHQEYDAQGKDEFSIYSEVAKKKIKLYKQE